MTIRSSPTAATSVTPSSTPSSIPSSTRRWLALDLLRGLAVVLMIQGHTFTALLDPAALQGSWGQWHSLLHGLTAPMFLLGGGLAYGFVIMRSTEQALRRRMLRRACVLMTLGYVLQLPKAPPSVWLHDPELLAGALRVGPLQLIGACLLWCELMRTLLPARSQLVSMLGVQAVAVSSSAPVIWKLHASQRGWLPLGTWLDGYAGSLFPFFPWAVFFLLGVVVSFAVVRVLESRRSERQAAWLLTLSGVGSSSAAYLAYANGYTLERWYGQHELWHTSPLYVLFRAGAVLVLLGSLWILEPLWRGRWRATGTLETVVAALSQHSLVAYVVHLLVLYGTPFTTGLIHYGATLSLLQTSCISLLLIVFTVGSVLLWQRLSPVRLFRLSTDRSA